MRDLIALTSSDQGKTIYSYDAVINLRALYKERDLQSS
jgi:hypothetical protein